MSLPLYAVDVGDFAHTEGDTLYTETLSHIIIKNLYAMKVAGYNIEFLSEQETTELINSFETHKGVIEDFLASAFNVPSTRDLPAIGSLLPDLITTGTNLMMRNPYLMLLAKLVYEVTIIAAEYYFRKDDSSDINNVVEVLKKALISASGEGIVDKVHAGSSNEEYLSGIKNALEEIASGQTEIDFGDVRISGKGKVITW